MVWFGAVVAVTLQTAYLSPPVAMSAYYLKQVVREWSLATIYKGMFEFMVLQCIAIALIVIFPWIATSFPEQVRREHAETKVEKIDDSKNRLEEDPFETFRRNPRSAIDFSWAGCAAACSQRRVPVDAGPASLR